jgi:hypothetical protein
VLESSTYEVEMAIEKLKRQKSQVLIKSQQNGLNQGVEQLALRGHLYTMGLFQGDPPCRFCRKETETVQHIICCCEALAHQRYNVFGNQSVEPRDISTASVRDPCLFIRDKGLMNLC